MYQSPAALRARPDAPRKIRHYVSRDVHEAGISVQIIGPFGMATTHVFHAGQCLSDRRLLELAEENGVPIVER